jgi:hypothetical protein
MQTARKPRVGAKHLLWVLPLAVVGAWFVRTGHADAPPALAPAAPAAPAARRDVAPPASKVNPVQLAAVEQQVAARNKEAQQDREAFIAAGWTMVNVPPPDDKLVNYNPALLEGRENELRVQLASTTPSPGHVSNVAEIARKAHEPATRFAAVEALSHNGGPEAQAALIDLLLNGKMDPNDLARQTIPSMIQPSDLNDPVAVTMAKMLDNPSLTPVERKQIAFNLALVGLRDGMTLDPKVSATMSPAAQSLLASMTDFARHAVITRSNLEGGRP